IPRAASLLALLSYRSLLILLFILTLISLPHSLTRDAHRWQASKLLSAPASCGIFRAPVCACWNFPQFRAAQIGLLFYDPMNNVHSASDSLSDFTTDLRVLLLSAMALVIGVVSAFVAYALQWLIAVITNLAFFHRFSAATASPRDAHLGAWV